MHNHEKVRKHWRRGERARTKRQKPKNHVGTEKIDGNRFQNRPNGGVMNVSKDPRGDLESNFATNSEISQKSRSNQKGKNFQPKITVALAGQHQEDG